MNSLDQNAIVFLMSSLCQNSCFCFPNLIPCLFCVLLIFFLLYFIIIFVYEFSFKRFIMNQEQIQKIQKFVKNIILLISWFEDNNFSYRFFIVIRSLSLFISFHFIFSFSICLFGLLYSLFMIWFEVPIRRNREISLAT